MFIEIWLKDLVERRGSGREMAYSLDVLAFRRLFGHGCYMTRQSCWVEVDSFIAWRTRSTVSRAIILDSYTQKDTTNYRSGHNAMVFFGKCDVFPVFSCYSFCNACHC